MDEHDYETPDGALENVCDDDGPVETPRDSSEHTSSGPHGCVPASKTELDSNVDVCQRCLCIPWKLLLERSETMYERLFIVEGSKILSAQTSCRICRVLSWMVVDKGLPDGPYALTRCIDLDVPDLLKGNADQQARLLNLIPLSGRSRPERAARLVITSFHPDIEPLARNLFCPQVVDTVQVKRWMWECETKHSKDCVSDAVMQTALQQLRVIDCERSIVVAAPVGCLYVALSYVWGKQKSASEGLLNPPTTIAHSIHLTRMLGYRYLWVDRYCIDQDNPFHKHTQIMQMGDIYAAAQITLIAAAGSDPTFGLPGVFTCSRTAPPYENIGNAWLRPVQRPTTLAEVAQSQWASRAWTFQEFHRSRRRLIFTEREAIFVCNSGIRYETMLPRDAWGQEGKEPDSYWLQQWLPQCIALGDKVYGRTAMDRATGYLEAYSKRHLTYDTDALDAIAGALDPLAQISTYHIWGVPFHHTYKYPWMSNSMTSSSLSDKGSQSRELMRDSTPTRQTNTLGDQNLEHELPSMLWEIENLVPRSIRLLTLRREQRNEMALLWYHTKPCRRRPEFPSWSSLAWPGPLQWYREDASLDPHVFLAHVPQSKLHFADVTYEMTSFVPTRDYSFVSTPPKLEITAKTVRLERFNVWDTDKNYTGDAWRLALNITPDFKLGLDVYWDVDPKPLGGTYMRGALVYGRAGALLEAFMIVLAKPTSRCKFYERVGIVKLPQHLENPLYGDGEIKGSRVMANSLRDLRYATYRIPKLSEYLSLCDGSHGLHWYDIFKDCGPVIVA